MKKLFLFSLASFLLLFSSNLLGQTTLTLQPGPKDGKDAYIRDLYPDLNNGIHSDICAAAWTNGSAPVLARSIFQFDLSSIPQGAIIDKACLTLYNNPSSTNNGGSHSSRSGSNKSLLKLVTSSWSESTVTWNNQPTTTNKGAVILAKSSSENEDYLCIGVTDMVQNMVDKPAENYGFLLQVADESYYRCMVFASSDCSDTTKHPKLEIEYKVKLPTDVAQTRQLSNGISTFPNPCNQVINFDVSHESVDGYSLEMYTLQGKRVFQQNGLKNSSGHLSYNISALKPSLYMAVLSSEHGVLATKKIQVIQ